MNSRRPWTSALKWSIRPETFGNAMVATRRSGPDPCESREAADPKATETAAKPKAMSDCFTRPPIESPLQGDQADPHGALLLLARSCEQDAGRERILQALNPNLITPVCGVTVKMMPGSGTRRGKTRYRVADRSRSRQSEAHDYQLRP